MRKVFTDTYYWIAVLNTNGEDYKQVIQFGQANPNMIVMQRMEIFEVLTHDKHFTQEGFTILFP